MSPDWEDRVAGWASTLDAASIPDDVLRYARLVILDTLGAMIAGSAEDEVKAFSSRLARFRGGNATVVGHPDRFAPSHAALVNGTAGSWKQLDEANFGTRQHPAIHVLPAVLALAQDLGSSRDELVLAFVIGYELCARIGRSARIRSEVMHVFGTHGTVGGAVACSQLVSRSKSLALSSFNIASAMTLASPRKPLEAGATVHNVLAGVSGQNAILAAQLAEAGIEGAPGTLPVVLGKISGTAFDPAALVADLDGTYLITRNFIKPYACCADVTAAVAAISDAVAREPFDPAAIESVEIATYFPATRMSEPRSDTEIGAQFSLPYVVATRLLHGSLDMADFSRAGRARPDVNRLMRSVIVVEDEAFTRAYPAEQKARIRLTLKGGRQVSGAGDVSSATDGNRQPADIVAKFTGIAVPIIGESRTSRIVDALGDRAPGTVQDLSSALAGGEEPA